MKSQTIQIVLFLCLALPGIIPVSAQDIGYYRANYFKSLVTANKSGRLVSENEVFVKAVKANAGLSIFFNKLQELQNFHVYHQYHDSGDYTEIKPIAELTGAESGETYSGLSRLIVYLPDTGQYKITYSLEAEDPMLAGTLNPIDESYDSIRYIYKIPEKFKLLYKIDGDSTRIIHSRNKKTEEFCIHPRLKSHDYMLMPGQEMFQMPVVVNLRVLIVPAEFGSKPESYFADWYYRSLRDNDLLNEASRRFADSLCAGLTDTMDIVRTLYTYVNQKINYIGLFDKWNAFIPQRVDGVLEKRFGDCKNMANLLTSLLKYKGVKAYYGITASVYHPVEMDFPSLASGDHAICVVRAGGQWYFLDPTNKLMLELTPPGYLQGRKVFVVDRQYPFYLEVPLLPPSQNVNNLNVSLVCDNQGMHGNFQYLGTHSFRQDMLNTFLGIGNPVFTEMLPEILLGGLFSFSADNVSYSVSDTSFEAGGKLYLPGELPVRLQNGRFALFPSFVRVPVPFTLSNQKFDLITYVPHSYHLSYRIGFDRDIKLIEKPRQIYRNGGVTFEYSVSRTGASEITIDVLYEIYKTVYRVPDLEALNECSSLVYKTLRDAIELE